MDQDLIDIKSKAMTFKMMRFTMKSIAITGYYGDTQASITFVDSAGYIWYVSDSYGTLISFHNKSEEDKMQAATDAAINRTIDLTSLLPNLKVCNIMLNDGKPLLQVNNGTVSFTHELTNAELTRIQQALGNANLSDAEKQRSIASVINGIVVSQQMSQNYQQGVEAQQSQQESMQRK